MTIEAEDALGQFIRSQGGVIHADSLHALYLKEPRLKSIIGKLSDFCAKSARLLCQKHCGSRSTVTLRIPEVAGAVAKGDSIVTSRSLDAPFRDERSCPI